ncbi:MAG: phosphatidylserine decarboxylase [Oligoflexia bacterium]|nr:phosphatidylserine decarboxylase [Oligoflexia bacterium]
MKRGNTIQKKDSSDYSRSPSSSQKKGQKISFYDRKGCKMQEEKIYGEATLRFLYESKRGFPLANIFSYPFFSKIYGLYYNSFLSRRDIPLFIEKFEIKMEEYCGHYRNFNDFFIRRFRSGARSFESADNLMASFAEGKYFAYEKVAEDNRFPVKGQILSSSAILQNKEWEKIFKEGPLMVARLCPVDYHRFHFPDDGEVIDYYTLPGRLHSVNPLSLNKKNNIFVVNERQVTILDTKNFGKIAYIEVGALGVGKIKQTYDFSQPFKRGDEKGHFLFGASTVIIMGEKGKWRPDDDLLEMTKKCTETFVCLGDHIAYKL